MLVKTTASVQKKEAGLTVMKAVADKDVQAALRLRFEVFNIEMNEGLASSHATGLDEDGYDRYCDHIIVADPARDLVVGTYRLMTGAMAAKGIGFYSESEFELSNLKSLPGEKLELGRACVHRDYRGSAVLNLMWAGIARYIEEHDVRFVFGCGSIHTVNPMIVSNIYAYLKSGHLVDESLRVTPRNAVPGFDPDARLDRRTVLGNIPPLMLAYMRLGARVCGEPAFDAEFGVSDFLVLLDRDRLLERYRDRYF
jgi:putative hemolysin